MKIEKIFIMKMASLNLLTILTGLGSVCTLSHNSHYGTVFDLGMIPMYHNYNPDITLDVASNTNGQIALYIPYLNINRTQSLNNGHTSIKVENQLIRRGNYSERRGLQIKTDVPVAVYVTLNTAGDTESYLALPNTFTGKSYIATSFEPPYPEELSETLIVGSDINTVVNITSPRRSTSSVYLNWLDANQIASGDDVTGTVISANATVSVLAGTTCANVPKSNMSDCGLILEQMIPSDAWEKEYIVPNMPPKTGVLIRALSHKSHDVCFYTKRGPSCKQIPHPYPLDFSTGPEPVVVRSNNTISVMSYGIGGGPFMTTVPGIKNFMNGYYFIVPPSYGSYNNSVAIVIQSSKASGLLLDGSTIKPSQSFNVPQPFDNYSVLVSTITSGFHTLSHQDMSVTFGAFLYGHEGDNAGYGFPLGMQRETGLPDRDLRGPLCYDCDNMFSPDECDTLKLCDKGQVCSIEETKWGTNSNYRMGCSHASCSPVKRPVHVSARSTRICQSCCSEDYCNLNCTVGTGHGQPAIVG